MPLDTPRTARLIGIVALAGLAAACLLVLRPFVSALLWAVILAFSTWPVFTLVRQRLRLSPGFGAALMVVALFLVVGLPIILATPTSREEIDGLRNSLEGLITDGLPGLGRWLSGLPVVGPSIHSWIGDAEFDLLGLAGLLRPYAGTLTSQAVSILLAVLSGIAELLLAIVLAFFFYRDGPAMAKRVEALALRLAGATGVRMMTLAADVTRGVVWGLVGTAIAQGILTGIGLWIAGVPQAVLLAVIAGVISILPVGAPLIWIPSALWLLTQGQTGWGIFMALYGALVISSVDNIIRPWAIARGADLPLLLTLMGALGGVFAFGFLGLFLGPVVLAVGYTLLLEFAAGVEEGPQSPSAPTPPAL
ncbi:AI-2E family transporter [Roseomonas terrae]|jgi:predicted PurR-regulated permease PerM|uniref:AI-2E family transporter n=1 Tax=Neoroseomonas terrae TaxID=424799 RepID=A0ABS5EKH9_9PROT|nr:AI-2E family transporter [Neoroseomonas terrae]MBR0651526.1 AI-2E family transporter [Neoroseomonas terrae]